jgi:hypothetical protein
MRTHPNILVNPVAGQRTEILRRADQLEDRIDLRVAIEQSVEAPHTCIRTRPSTFTCCMGSCA